MASFIISIDPAYFDKDINLQFIDYQQLVVFHVSYHIITSYVNNHASTPIVSMTHSITMCSWYYLHTRLEVGTEVGM